MSRLITMPKFDYQISLLADVESNSTPKTTPTGYNDWVIATKLPPSTSSTTAYSPATAQQFNRAKTGYDTMYLEFKNEILPKAIDELNKWYPHQGWIATLKDPNNFINKHYLAGITAQTMQGWGPLEFGRNIELMRNDLSNKIGGVNAVYRDTEPRKTSGKNKMAETMAYLVAELEKAADYVSLSGEVKSKYNKLNDYYQQWLKDWEQVARNGDLHSIIRWRAQELRTAVGQYQEKTEQQRQAEEAQLQQKITAVRDIHNRAKTLYNNVRGYYPADNNFNDAFEFLRSLIEQDTPDISGNVSVANYQEGIEFVNRYATAAKAAHEFKAAVESKVEEIAEEADKEAITLPPVVATPVTTPAIEYVDTSKEQSGRLITETEQKRIDSETAITPEHANTSETSPATNNAPVTASFNIPAVTKYFKTHPKIAYPAAALAVLGAAYTVKQNIKL